MPKSNQNHPIFQLDSIGWNQGWDALLKLPGSYCTVLYQVVVYNPCGIALFLVSFSLVGFFRRKSEWNCYLYTGIYLVLVLVPVVSKKKIDHNIIYKKKPTISVS
jgi:hypothetical protein